jgi:uncharacterized protein YdaU (DUF1376 family)
LLYWPRYTGDYLRDTVHLTAEQDGFYVRLLDNYYSTERPLPLDRAVIYAMVRANTKHEKGVVDSVLDEFWLKTRYGFTNRRAKKEIVKMQEISRKRSSAGKQKGKRSANAQQMLSKRGVYPEPDIEPEPNQEKPEPSALSFGNSSRVALTAVEAEEGTNGNGKYTTASTATVKAFRALGHQPFGTHKFQAKWTARYNEAGSDPNWTDIMELTIQDCDAEHIKIPGLFYKHKHEIENGEVKMRYKVTPQ